jgi:hypothetical protein
MANMEMMIATFLEMPIPILKTPSESKPFGLWLMKGMQISMNSCEGINFKNTKKSRCILESVFKLVYVQQKI